MAEVSSQQYRTHRRYVPLYHHVLAGMLLLNLVWTIRHVVKFPTPQHWVELMMAVAFVIMAWYLREFPKAVQDRVIRLEEALRYQRVLPPDLQQRTGELTLRQTVGLRFAGDEELPGLVRRALDEQLSEEQIKKAVQHWRSDDLRA